MVQYFLYLHYIFLSVTRVLLGYCSSLLFLRQVAYASMGVGGQWIFIHGTDNVEGGLIVLFSVAPPPLHPKKFSADALVYELVRKM